MKNTIEQGEAVIDKAAYDGAREDLSIWKRRALEAEEKVRKYDQRIVDIGVIAMTPVTTPQPAPNADDVRDAERYRWLVADHDNKDTRQKCRDLLSRLGVMSYSAASSEIDQAIAQEVK